MKPYLDLIKKLHDKDYNNSDIYYFLKKQGFPNFIAYIKGVNDTEVDINNKTIARLSKEKLAEVDFMPYKIIK